MMLSPKLAHRLFAGFCLLLLVALCPPPGHAAEPALPQGLQRESDSAPRQTSDDEPALPSGLDAQPSVQPELPSGLGADAPSASAPDQPSSEQTGWQLPPGLGGFWEVRGGARVKDDPHQDDFSLAEARLQLRYGRALTDLLPRGRFQVTGDLIFDTLDDNRGSVDLERGQGWLDLRELWLSLTPLNFLDVKAGRQVLTWGTGNLIFLNDLFPKDYQSFFLGRHLEYLKAPSDAVKASFYSDPVNLDVVYTPRFDADRYVSGERLSFFDPAAGRMRGEANPLQVQRPDTHFEDDEIALRLYRTIGAWEVAAYGYDGFWKSPSGTDRQTGRRIFPPLAGVGASVRGAVGPGIGNLETVWYHSKDDPDGNDPFVENSQLRFLAGYEMEVVTDLTMGVQYYLERMLDYDAYLGSLPPGMAVREENRQWLTLDLTQELMAQNQLVVGLFVIYATATGDAYLRPKFTYDHTDRWQFQLGANLFYGERTAFFGQFEQNSNVYAATRFSF